MMGQTDGQTDVRPFHRLYSGLFACVCIMWHFWKYYSVAAFRAAYNECTEKLFVHAVSDSMSGILADLARSSNC